ncbi:MAG: chemotaxis protein CheX [Syntrophus sp. (in: bacteria)]|nr:chemotaxis protein CheX [Syntrophus sp. (in: bacteria)]
MHVEYINPFIIATTTVFKTMLNIDLTMNKPILRNTRISTGDVTGIMGLAGDTKGTISISFTKAGALFVYKTLMGEDHAGIDPDVVDAIGELTNITSGQARKEFEKTNINLKAAIPMVIVGKDVELHMISALPIVSLPFHFQTNNSHEEIVHVDFSFE